MAEKEVLIDWIKKHKKKLILADETSQRVTDPIISTNLDDMLVLEAMDFNIPKVESDLIDVCSHIRNLHEGWTPSAEKIASAAQMGYELNSSQTWVEKYTKRKFAA